MLVILLLQILRELATHQTDRVFVFLVGCEQAAVQLSDSDHLVSQLGEVVIACD